VLTLSLLLASQKLKSSTIPLDPMSGTIKFTGAGVNGPSSTVAVNNATFSPSAQSLPPGATWPFVSLKLSDKTAEIKLVHIKKVFRSTDTTVTLSKYGYVFFHSPSQGDFGFGAINLMRLLAELRSHGFKMDKSCTSNLVLARIVHFLLIAIPALMFVLITTLSILWPNGLPGSETQPTTTNTHDGFFEGGGIVILFFVILCISILNTWLMYRKWRKQNKIDD
jgi:hypothetical protein